MSNELEPIAPAAAAQPEEPRDGSELLRLPSETHATPPSAFAEPVTPIAALAVCAVLVAVFILELVLRVGPLEGISLSPSVQTLFVMGGMTRDAVSKDGEWWRLITCGFLHAGVVHLLCNGLALFGAASVVEGVFGRRWFFAMYLLSLLGGSLLSFATHKESVVSIGASGAVMGILAFALVGTLRLSAELRVAAATQLIQWLIPSLLPFLSFSGGKVDIAAHIGGALVGGIVGLVVHVSMGPVVRDSNPLRVRVMNGLAVVVIATGVCATLFSASAARQSFQKNVEKANLERLLAPSDEYLDDVHGRETLEALAQKFPRDPLLLARLAEKYWAEEKLVEARAHFERAKREQQILRSFWPDGKLAKIIEDELAQVAEQVRISELRAFLDQTDDVFPVDPVAQRDWVRQKLAQYPRDPSVLHRGALLAWDEGNPALAEERLRAALADEELLRFFSPEFRYVLKGWYAELLLQTGRRAEAIEMAREVCTHTIETARLPTLRTLGLCS